MSNSTNITSQFITSPYYIEGLYIEPSQSVIIENNETRNVQPKVMEVLTYLCSKAEQLVSADELIKVCWPNQYIGDSPLHKCIAQIRKALADDPKNPRFIKTVPKKGYVFIAKVKGLNTSTQQPAIPYWTGDSPYPGLTPYTLAQSDVFFGRAQVIEDINQWVAQLDEQQTAWLSLSASVGTGKTSLVNAGLLPSFLSHSFIDTSQQDFCLTLDLAEKTEARSNEPHIQLLTLLLQRATLSSAYTPQEYADRIAAQLVDSCSVIESAPPSQVNIQLMEWLQSQLLTDNTHSRFVIFVDHLETFFDAHASNKPIPQNQACFFLLLQALVNSKKCLLITSIREHFLPELAHSITQYKDAFQYKVPAFSLTELIDVIEKPVQLAGLRFEYNEENRERLSSVIIQQLQQKPVPIGIVQFLLAQLYAQKSKQLITYKAYQKIGGIAGCLANIAEQHYQKLTEQQQISFEKILFRIITLSANGQLATSEQPCPISHFADNTKLLVLNQFINAGIFQLTCINEQAYIFLAHDSLLTNWSRISRWIKKNIAKLYIRHDLQIASQRWLYHEKSNHLLIHSNKKLKLIQGIIKGDDFTISADEKDLITLSVNKLKRANRIRKIIAATFVVSFVSLAWLSVTLIEKNQQITTTRNNAENLISFMLGDLKDKLAPLGKLELLYIVADKTLDYFKVAGTDHLTGKALNQWVESLHILGEVNISKNNFAEAEAYFNQTHTALKQALSQGLNHLSELDQEHDKSNDKNGNKRNAADNGNSGYNNHENLLELTMLANYWLGYSAYLQVDYEKAEPYWENYLEYANQLMQLFPNDNWRLEQSYALNNLGSLAEKTNQLDSASHYFEQSAQIKLTLLETKPNNTTIRADLADTRSWQSNIHAKAGKLKIAISYLHDALAQVEKIHLTDPTFKYIEHLSELEHKQALMYYDAGDLDEAQNYSAKAQKNIEQLTANDNKNELFKLDLLWSYLLSVQIFINQNQLDQALINVDKAVILINELKSTKAQLNEIVQANVYLLQYQARIMALLNQYQSALMAINNAITLFNKHLSTDTDIAFYGRLRLTKLEILNISNSVNQVALTKELDTVRRLLESKLQLDRPNFKTLATYQTTIDFIRELQLHTPSNTDKRTDNPWLLLYQNSDYNIPDYSIWGGMSNNKKN
ncbi:winged helix-turn-helix domain-containing protein [Colwelliaceae bacterium 6471]